MEFFVTGAIIFTVVVAALYWRWLRIDYYWEERGVPHMPRLSLISTLRLIASKPIHEIIQDNYKKYGRVHGSFDYRSPFLTVSEPDLLRDILVKDFHVFHYFRDYIFGDILLDNMVCFLRGEDWKRVRTIMTPAFVSKRISQILHVMDESCETIIETLGKYSDGNKPVECKEIFREFSMDVLARATYGKKIGSVNDPDNIFARHMKNSLTHQSVYWFMISFLLPKCIVRRYRMGLLGSMYYLKDEIYKEIIKRRSSDERHNDILQILLDAQNESRNAENVSQLEDETDHFGSVTNIEMKPLSLKDYRISDDEIIAQCVIVFFFGYETTALVLACLAYSLATNPECQEKLIKEVDDVFVKHRELNYDVIRDMKYLDYVVSETLRMYPLVARSEKTASEDYKLGTTGIVIEKGTTIGYTIHAMHHDPEFFENPEKFNPERFMAGNIKHPQYAYLPFGAGPKSCPGMRFALMEIKLCISKILRNYRFKQTASTKIPLEYEPARMFITPKEVPLLIERRNDL